MLKHMLTGAAIAAASLLIAAPAQAQSGPAQSGVLVIYGNDKCPTNSNGDEIVVCRRLDESERFRIPSTLREQPGTPQETESWATRAQGAVEAGRYGTNSCSAAGAGGGTGCFVRRATKWKAEDRARRAAQTDLPLP